MKPMGRARRLAAIIKVCIRHRLDAFIDRGSLPLPARWLFALAVFGGALLLGAGLSRRRAARRSRGARLRSALEELGPVFVKFGQLLSTRRDLLPADVADELKRLQSEVPAFPGEEAAALIKSALGAPVGKLFASFDVQPLASASIAQVHAATLHSGEAVAVKVLRPGIRKVIRQDLALMYALARLLRRFSADGKRLRPVEVIADYETALLDELDLQREAANTAQLRRNFKGSPLLYIPEVHWEYTRPGVFVMERIRGVPVAEVDTLAQSGADLKVLAERGVEIFFAQVFRDSFFHADMHPGNIFVDVSDPAAPSYIAVDCAIIGALSEFDQYYLARNLLAIFRRDYRECAELHVECGWVPPDTRAQDFESAIRTVCEPVFEKPLGEISFGHLLVHLFQTARRFDMELQPSLVLLQKTLLNIEGLGRQLYPQLDLWSTARPYLENWLRERYSPKAMLRRLQRAAPSWLEQLPRLPEAVLSSLSKTRQLEHSHRLQRERLSALQRQLRRERAARRLLWAALLIAAALFAGKIM